MENIKSKIIDDLEFNITPTYTRYGVENDLFVSIVDELAKEGKVIYELINIRLPDGSEHPLNGNVKYIKLIK